MASFGGVPSLGHNIPFVDAELCYLCVYMWGEELFRCFPKLDYH